MTTSPLFKRVPVEATREMMSAAGDAVAAYIAKMEAAGGEVAPTDYALRAIIHRAMLAAFPEPPAEEGETGWQPIETAPTGDDDFFLVCGAGDDRPPFVVRGAILKSARQTNTPSHLHLHWLTHWMPLPGKPGARR